MRNRIYLLLYTILIIAILPGCKKYLDLQPRNQRTVTSIADIQSLLGAYLKGVAEPRIIPLMGSVVPALPTIGRVMFEAYSDNLDFETALDQTYLQPNNISVYSRREQTYGNLLLWNEYAGADTLWKQHYRIIGFLNSLISQMDVISDGTLQDRERLLGEMYVHRAYYFFKLLEYFAPYDKPEMGIPVYLNTGGGVLGVQLARSSHAEVYKVILEDLTKARQLITTTTPKQGFNVFFNKRYIDHLLTQVYWFKAESPAKEAGDYDKVKTFGLSAIEGVDAYIPVDSAGRVNSYAGQNPNYPAQYMESNFQGDVGIIYGSAYQYLGPGVYGPEDIPINAEFANLFAQTDIRISNYFNTNATRAGGKVGTAGKTLNWGWPADGTEDGYYKSGNLCLFKPEDAYLMVAEAYFRMNATGEAVTILNKFKGFRKAGTANGLSGAALLQEIINERRKEFFADSDKRWLDLKRYRYKTITRNITLLQKKYNISVAPNDFRYALPIPLEELQQNKNMVANPGWQLIEF